MSKSRSNSLPRNNTQSAFEPEFIFIGGGPNGLYAAANLKLSCSTAKILIIERNEKYSRDYHLYPFNLKALVL